MTDASTHITQVGTVIIAVNDQDRALEFYLGKLGFEKRMDAPFGEGRWVEVAPPGAATTIALVPPREGDPIGFEVSFATRDADAAVIRMAEFVPPMFTFRDPDGNRFRMVQRD